MKNGFMKDALWWGIALWFLGYVLGILFFLFVPRYLIGWYIMPVGTAVALWVLFTKVKGTTRGYYVKLSFAWTGIAILCDYVFLVTLMKPADGYYKADVYLYYLITFLLPIAVGWQKKGVR